MLNPHAITASPMSAATAATATATTLFTTPIFYVNSKPHLGHAYSLLLTDALTRWHRLAPRPPRQSNNADAVHLSTGTDEHGQKIHRVATENGIDTKQWCDSVSKDFRTLARTLNIVSDHRFIRTTSPEHRETVLSLWRKLCSNGAIFKGKQEGWYCVSDEAFYSADEVEVIHSSGQVVARESGRPVQWLSEDNYRFRLHEFIEPVQRWLRCAAPIQPASRLHDLQPFLRRIQQEAMELSVSRKRSTVRWGIPVPGDEEDQLIYVWIDALASYLTAAGDASILSETSHVIGKDILKFHAVYWPALLTAAGLPLPRRIIAHGHWTHGGQKMSKSLGNVVDPVTVIRDAFHGDADPLRYFLLRTGRLDADGHFDLAALKDCYHRELVGTLGNLVSRVFKSADVQVGVEADIQVDVEAEAKAQAQAQAQADSYAQTQTDKQRASYAQTDRCGLDPQIDDAIDAFDEQLPQHFANVRLPAVADCLQGLLAAGNAFLSHQQPWRRLDAWPHCRRNIRALLQAARPALEPLAPGAAAKIDAILQGGSQAAIPKGGIFPRLPR